MNIKNAIYANPGEVNIVYDKIYLHIFYPSVKKQHQDIYLDKMIYENPNEVKIKSVKIYMCMKLYPDD